MLVSQLYPSNNTCGSISFPGYTDSYIQIPYNENMRLHKHDFTIEWFQYMEHAPHNTHQTLFSIGKPPNCAIGVTFFFRDELWHLELYVDGIQYYICPVEILNTWIHFAITRKGSNLYMFKGGVECARFDMDSNINYENPNISLGNMYPASRKWAFKGCISNLRWIVGRCLYETGFTVPSFRLQSIPGTKLLLLMKKEDDALKDSTQNVSGIQHIEGRHTSPPDDSIAGANKIMWISTRPFSSA